MRMKNSGTLRLSSREISKLKLSLGLFETLADSSNQKGPFLRCLFEIASTVSSNPEFRVDLRVLESNSLRLDEVGSRTEVQKRTKSEL